MVHITTLSLSETMTGWLVNNYMERMWKEARWWWWPNFEVLYLQFPGGAEWNCFNTYVRIVGVPVEGTFLVQVRSVINRINFVGDLEVYLIPDRTGEMRACYRSSASWVHPILQNRGVVCGMQRATLCKFVVISSSLYPVVCWRLLLGQWHYFLVSAPSRSTSQSYAGFKLRRTLTLHLCVCFRFFRAGSHSVSQVQSACSALHTDWWGTDNHRFARHFRSQQCPPNSKLFYTFGFTVFNIIEKYAIQLNTIHFSRLQINFFVCLYK
jgi:hypothetical protein